MSVKTDRSRIEEYQRCPMRRWLGHERKDAGMTLGGFKPNRPAFALEIGSGFHKGMETIGGAAIYLARRFPEAITTDLLQTINREVLDAAVAAGIKEYDENILPYFTHLQQKSALSLGAPGDAEVETWEEEDQDSFNNYTVSEGRALVEALIRVYCAAPAGLASLLEEYEILEVEQEIDAPLDRCARCNGDGICVKEPRETFDMGGERSYIKQDTCPDCNGSGGSIILMSRPDGILRHRKDGQLYVLSFKTTGKWDKRKADSGKYDIEGLSQLIAAEHKYGEQFAAVQMVYIVKGYKMKDKFDDTWKTYNGVIRPYLKRGVTGDDDQYSFSYDYVKDTGEAGKLGKGWEKINIWEQGPDAIKDWVAQLRDGRWPQDKYGHVDHLDKMVITPPPFWRDEQTMEEWREAVVYQETAIARNAELANTIEGHKAQRRALTTLFPKYRHSCSYPTPCAFIPVCHEGVTLLESGMFTPREANHPSEYVTEFKNGLRARLEQEVSYDKS